ncbi:hypothetical protein ACIP98_04625 [Streptomyces sp. NPDC088354]|uniref:hypothetical protein n=1 Tax=unclassified Streptomyces TaxID=2593676 RepID=UPI0029B54055|nr:hypothetical protein [Streptomyces sp. MI02-7b]MDX3070925.1 hypothetical protein [Streptomyces sp. MI02-7b]
MSKTARKLTKAREATTATAIDTAAATPAVAAIPPVTVVTTAVTAADADAAARRARFGALPERVRPEETTEVIPLIAKYPSQDHYDHEKWLTCRWV